MTEAFRVIGPPGTGKSSYVAQQAKRAVEIHGEAGVTICSLTCAAAEEIARRDTGVSPECVGTMHALAYRVLGKPTIVRSQDIRDWNELHPDMALPPKGATKERDGTAPGDSEDDAWPGLPLLLGLDLARARIEEELPLEISRFGDAWTAFKQLREIVDFTDLIELAIERGGSPPGGDAIFCDEVQDFSKLELELAERWARLARTLVLVGDAQQSVYSWRGSDPDILAGAPHKVLDKSYRVPAAVLDVALDVIHRSGDWRDDVVYSPRDGDDGAVERLAASWQDGEHVAEVVAELLAGHETVMVLGSCAYMLGPVVAALRRAGVPYHNPGTDRWNPLSPTVRARARAVLAGCREDLGGPERDSSYLFTPLEARDLAAPFLLAKSVDADEGVILKGKRDELLAVRDDATPGEVLAVVSSCVTRHALAALSGGDVDWLRAQLRKAEAGMDFALRCVATQGWGAIEKKPRVVIGTIHSCKGSESSAVILFPDLSPAGAAQFEHPGWDGRDAIYRTFYVGVTRAINTLVLTRAARRAKWLKMG